MPKGMVCAKSIGVLLMTWVLAFSSFRLFNGPVLREKGFYKVIWPRSNLTVIGFKGGGYGYASLGNQSFV